MTDDELVLYGMQLCSFGGDCDFCRQVAANGDYFWLRTSYEYIEGDYYCRTCATKEAEGIDLFHKTGVPHHLTPEGL
jgi:hypothetical protein